ncbi:hypothetical protein G6L37_06160 [Agrobacterium rubi]|nr:hypothetical protein [Agrobacterium rubi]NTF24945.1 hypothetical protein [Agrobacterium rubi]
MSDPVVDDRDIEIARLRRENASLRDRFESLHTVYHDNGQEYRDEIGVLRENARYMIERLQNVLGSTGFRPGEARPSVNRTGALEQAVLDCPHEETEDTLILMYDPTKRGATVGSQLCIRISAALGMSSTRSDEYQDRAPSDPWLFCNPSGIDRAEIIDLLREVSTAAPLENQNWGLVRERARKLANALKVMPHIQTDEDTSRAACRLLQQLSAIPTSDLSQHDRDIRTLIDATWQRGTPAPDNPAAEGVPLWIIERIRNCELEANIFDYIGLADHAAFSAGQDNAVCCVINMLLAARKETVDV